jgi:hypothetical protein
MALMSLGFTTLVLVLLDMILSGQDEMVVAVLKKSDFLPYISIYKVPHPKNFPLSDEIGFTLNFQPGFTYNV